MSERENTPLPAIAGREVGGLVTSVIGPAYPVDGGPVVMGDPSGMDLDGMFDVIDAGRGEVTK